MKLNIYRAMKWTGIIGLIFMVVSVEIMYLKFDWMSIFNPFNHVLVLSNLYDNPLVWFLIVITVIGSALVSNKPYVRRKTEDKINER